MKTLVILLTCITTTAVAQNITIEKVSIKETIDGKYTSEIPRLKPGATLIAQEQVCEKINAYLLERFELTSYDQKEITEFRWYDVKFESEIKSGIAWIHFSGEYYAAYPSPIDEEIFFDLATGESLTNTDLPFHALCTLNGYLDFLTKYWLTGAKAAIQKAVDCAGADPYCTIYDIGKYKVENGNLIAQMQGDCYPHAAMACSPDYSITVPVDSIKKYLNPTGARALFKEGYTARKGVSKYFFNKDAWPGLPVNYFLFGRIDDKYPISIAITIDPSANVITGYYYYDKRRQKLSLSGEFTDGVMQMIETVDKIETGKFSIAMSDQYVDEALTVFNIRNEMKYLKGTWSSPDGAKKLVIHFTEMKSTY